MYPSVTTLDPPAYTTVVVTELPPVPPHRVAVLHAARHRCICRQFQVQAPPQMDPADFLFAQELPRLGERLSSDGRYVLHALVPVQVPKRPGVWDVIACYTVEGK